MAGQRRRASIRAKAHRSSRPPRRNSRAKAQLKPPRRHSKAKERGPRISRQRVRMLHEDLERARSAMTETVERFWITPDHDIREMLARTQQKIGRVAETLSRAAETGSRAA